MRFSLGSPERLGGFRAKDRVKGLGFRVLRCYSFWAPF